MEQVLEARGPILPQIFDFIKPAPKRLSKLRMARSILLTLFSSGFHKLIISTSLRVRHFQKCIQHWAEPWGFRLPPLRVTAPAPAASGPVHTLPVISHPLLPLAESFCKIDSDDALQGSKCVACSGKRATQTQRQYDGLTACLHQGCSG